MKKITLLLLLIIPIFASAQELKKITEGDKYEKFIYYVLKSDPEIKHGNFQIFKNKKLQTNGFYANGLMDSIWTTYNAYSKNNEILSKGNYENDKKDGLWTEYFSNGNKESEGNYIKDARVGLWEFYTFTNEKDQVYDYTNKKVVYIKPFESDQIFKVIVGTDTILTKVDQPAVYIGSKRNIMLFLSKNMRYPENARENLISGKVWISFWIDSEGQAYGHKVKKGFDVECDEEALRVIKILPNNWAPAIFEGKPVTTEFEIPLNFSVQ